MVEDAPDPDVAVERERCPYCPDDKDTSTDGSQVPKDRESRRCEVAECGRDAYATELVETRDGGCEPFWMCEPCHNAYRVGDRSG